MTAARIAMAIAAVIVCGSPGAAGTPEKKTIPDVEVVDQDGRARRFVSDLVAAAPVTIVTFVYSSCDLVCPMQGQALVALQASLGNRLGREVSLVSVTVDPAVDTPVRLAAWRASLGGRAGWTLVTGHKTALDGIARAFTGADAAKGDHSPVAFVGSAEKGVWIRAYGLSSAARFGEYIDAIRRAPAAR